MRSPFICCCFPESQGDGARPSRPTDQASRTLAAFFSTPAQCASFTNLRGGAPCSATYERLGSLFWRIGPIRGHLPFQSKQTFTDRLNVRVSFGAKLDAHQGPKFGRRSTTRRSSSRSPVSTRRQSGRTITTSSRRTAARQFFARRLRRT